MCLTLVFLFLSTKHEYLDFLLSYFYLGKTKLFCFLPLLPSYCEVFLKETANHFF